MTPCSLSSSSLWASKLTVLKLYCASLKDAELHQARCRGRRTERGSAFAMSLLEYAVRDTWGIDLPEVCTLDTGKPVFPGEADRHFSLSHSGDYVLAAVSDAPVGADVEMRRKIGPQHKDRLLAGQELRGMDFFSLWCLRESLFKLRGKGDLRRPIRFAEDGSTIETPTGAAWYAVLSDIEGCGCAVCSEREFKKPEVIWVDIEKLCT